MKLVDVLSRIDAVPLRNGRRVIAIAGAPASGKSTLAAQLAAHREDAFVVPMDGFHKDNANLQAAGLLDRKGAPETFDAEGFVAFARGLRKPRDLRYPTFDRATDSVVINGGVLPCDARTVLVEGNYLLLDALPWSDLSDFWDFTLLLDVPIDVLATRLVTRWRNYGFDPDAARTRAMQNDIPNARLVRSSSVQANLTVAGTEF
ncbi:phosphoribulokinase [Ascidiaceihabitans sp.]|uniref:phosphoribulokinase n=1 Tax=Ascidiaceihabitans sp. TaxID=1872644 RepID=UPI00329A6EA5